MANFPQRKRSLYGSAAFRCRFVEPRLVSSPLNVTLDKLVVCHCGFFAVVPEQEPDGFEFSLDLWIVFYHAIVSGDLEYVSSKSAALTRFYFNSTH
jgi:hypothetical protein